MSLRHRVASTFLVIAGILLGVLLTLQFQLRFGTMNFVESTIALQSLQGVGPSREELIEIHRYYYLTPWPERYEALLEKSEEGDSYATFMIGYLIGNCSNADKDSVISRWAQTPRNVVNLEYGFPRFLVGLMAYRRESCRGIENYFQENEYNTFFREEGQRWEKRASEGESDLASIPRFAFSSQSREQVIEVLRKTSHSSVLFGVAVERASHAFMPEVPRFDHDVSKWGETIGELLARYDTRRYLLNVDINAWLLLGCFYSQQKCDLHDYLRGMSGFEASDFEAISQRTIELDQLLKARDWEGLQRELK